MNFWPVIWPPPTGLLCTLHQLIRICVSGGALFGLNNCVSVAADSARSHLATVKISYQRIELDFWPSVLSSLPITRLVILPCDALVCIFTVADASQKIQRPTMLQGIILRLRHPTRNVSPSALSRFKISILWSTFKTELGTTSWPCVPWGLYLRPVQGRSRPTACRFHDLTTLEKNGKSKSFFWE